ncbi:MAG: sulfide/dihydroorotate dehydrogenase-like FAD/NAD-binding protein [Candidatus Methanoperedens sp.]|nr:sulfide/dihydroorotate dehydrogenase-like FAD/NAD-binding protein [Candidatus Methanoperedens sp.]MCE8424454.1 sulfide/dihydroorotate dehydrogenase-like FAD/NAD-binding protein [Candidatus Methanoperedens sp.]MCE8426995.1 sulfide/dihydroorotate dehydrogenase-like FAD/NAD-binding protein [Candidatus Methanoperedens sp.]
MPFEIIRKQELVPTIYLMDISAPRIAKKAEPGQFVILRINGKGERIPLTIADFDRKKGIINMIFQAVGKTTMHLSTLKAGEELLDFIGPLGNPAHIQKEGTVIMVGGGVGVAPIFPQARAFKEAGNKVISIIGARSANLLLWEDKMKAVSDELYITTDDGTKGHHGFVTDIVKKLLESGTKIDRVVAIGPPVMMRAVAGVTKPFDVKTIVSLNSIMVDGTGMCGACRVLVGNETKFACVDGPEFDAHLVDFTLLMNRLSMYQPEEKLALEKYKCEREGCTC